MFDEFSGATKSVKVAKFPDTWSVSVCPRRSIIWKSGSESSGTENLSAKSAGISTIGIAPVIILYAPESSVPVAVLQSMSKRCSTAYRYEYLLKSPVTIIGHFLLTASNLALCKIRDAPSCLWSSDWSSRWVFKSTIVVGLPGKRRFNLVAVQILTEPAPGNFEPATKDVGLI